MHHVDGDVAQTIARCVEGAHNNVSAVSFRNVDADTASMYIYSIRSNAVSDANIAANMLK